MARAWFSGKKPAAQAFAWFTYDTKEITVYAST
jgi:hypothetical protein